MTIKDRVALRGTPNEDLSEEHFNVIGQASLFEVVLKNFSGGDARFTAKTDKPITL